MPPRSAPPTWRLPELLTPSTRPCPACGEIHRSLRRLTAVGDYLPVILPPGVPAPRHVGVEVEFHLAEPTERSAALDARSRYAEVAERMRRASLRCEGCGARCEDLEAYRVHPCEVPFALTDAMLAGRSPAPRPQRLGPGDPRTRDGAAGSTPMVCSARANASYS